MNEFQRNYQHEIRSADAERLENKFNLLLRANEINGAIRNLSGWDPESAMEFDFAFVPEKVAVEIQGGLLGSVVYCNHCFRRVTRMVKGREVFVREAMGHGTRRGLARDYLKMNRALLLDWLLFQVTEETMDDGSAITFLKDALKKRISSLP